MAGTMKIRLGSWVAGRRRPEVAGAIVLLLIALTSRATNVQAEGGPASAGSADAAAATDIVLALADAMGEGKPLMLYLRRQGGAVVGGFATASGYNSRWHALDCRGLREAGPGEAMAGVVVVHVQPDHWVPADGRPFDLRVRIDARFDMRNHDETVVVGTYELVEEAGSRARGEAVADASADHVSSGGKHARRGELSGRIEAPLDRGVRLADIAMHEAVPLEFNPAAGRPERRLARLRTLLLDGQPSVAGSLMHWGGGTYGNLGGAIVSMQLRLREGRLRGDLVADFEGVRSKQAQPMRMHLRLDGWVIAGVAAGQLVAERIAPANGPVGDGESSVPSSPASESVDSERSVESEEVGRSPRVSRMFMGTVQRASMSGAWSDGPTPTSADHRIVLSDAIADGEPIVLYLASDGGRISHGYAVAVLSTRTPLEVDVSDLRWSDGRLHGEAKVYESFPSDSKRGRERRAHVQLSLAPAAGGMRGRAVRLHLEGERKVLHADGSYEPAFVIPDRFRVGLKLEDGLTGWTYWQNRALVSFVYDRGRCTPDAIRSDHPIQSKWTGRLGAIRVDVDGRRMRMRVQAFVESTGRTKSGEYVFEIEGRVIAGTLTGRFTTFCEGERVKSGQVIGGISALPAP